MDSALLDKYRNLLLEQKQEIMNNAANTVNDMLAPAENFPDPTDRASLETDRSFNLRLRERERHLLNKIDGALERVNNGSFGICESCGEEISQARLEARPVSTLCIRCKNAQEDMEKLRGN
ncbi:MAG: RNA polymerase-binding protein DksA [Deltaproteobacteria bacterium]|jgi:DnaK suppressor protein|nr:RNA polymerase-binding protein DksA [Deltaproteobacteria bacterium]